MSIFRKTLEKVSATRASGYHGVPMLFDARLNKYLTGIKQEKYYAIAGRASSGKRSFTDLHFVFNPFIWWANHPGKKRPKIKVLYFNMDKAQDVKLQKWLCLYLQIYHQVLIDIPTLNGWPGKLYEIDENMDKLIGQAHSFFDLLLDSGFLTFYNGRTTPTGIRANVGEYFKGIGGLVQDGPDTRFEFDKGHENQITIIIIDNVRKLKTEYGQSGHLNEREQNKRFHNICSEIKELYKATPVVIVPSEDIGGHSVKVPAFQEFGIYYEADVALHLFNPSRYHSSSNNYGPYNMVDFTSDDDNINRFRALSILRNAEGRDSTWVPVSFIPENGFMLETPNVEDPNFIGHVHYLKTLKSKFL